MVTTRYLDANLRLAEAFFDSLKKTQHLEAEDLLCYQARLLGRLYDHARQEVSFYTARPKLSDAIDPSSSDWRDVPFVTRDDLATNKLALTALQMPVKHGEPVPVQSGGSTGKPVHLDLSQLEQYARSVLTYRMFQDWGMKQGLRLFMIRKSHPGLQRKDGVGSRKWAYPWIEEVHLGDRVHLDIVTPPFEQLDHLGYDESAYVNTLPSNLLRLGLAAEANKKHPNIPVIISVAEYLSPEVRELVHEQFGSRVINILSSSEAGIIAIECPHSGLLHIQAEAVLAEILDDEGNPVDEGETGELVVTAMYNYATPLIRYRSGDFVERGPTCPCGVTLPTISKIAGRKEHMFVFPDGSREIPVINRVAITRRLGNECWRWVQTSPETTEFQHQKPDKLGADTWKWLSDNLGEATYNSFKVSEKPNTQLPLTTGQKRHFTLNQCTS